MREVQTPRRALIKAGLGLGVALPLLGFAGARAEDDPKKMRPQPGDRFVYLKGDHKDEVVKAADLPLGGPQVMAYPMDPASETIRSGSRLNQVVLVRIPEDSINDETRPFSAEGVLAYSAVCTHQGCPISMWEDQAKNLFCSCHGTQFNPGDMARVVEGPAPRRLAILPLQIEDGIIVAAGEFEGAVGFKKPT